MCIFLKTALGTVRECTESYWKPDSYIMYVSTHLDYKADPYSDSEWPQSQACHYRDGAHVMNLT